MLLTLTENAAKQIQKQLEKRGKGLGLRLATKASGCSGFAYVIDYADEINDDDNCFEQQGVKVIIAEAHLKILEGITVDYRREGINEAFMFDNPNVTNTCGCGESFAVE